MSLLTYLNLSSLNGVLVKDGRALELLNKVDTVVFDKTGTLTKETPTVGNIYALGDYSEDDILSYAAAAEYKQTHPIAKAIQQKASAKGLIWPMIEEASYEVGYGLKVHLDNKVIHVGSLRFMELEEISIPTEIQEAQKYGHEHGYSLVCVAINHAIGGAIELRPTIRPEAKQLVSCLHKRNISTYIISGDHQKPTENLARELGIEHYFAETLPEQKSSLIENLQRERKSVCFVGDGINDSIALKKADLSISLRGASSIAIDTAQIILMDQSLSQIETLFEMGHDFDANMKEGLFITLLPNAISAGGVLFLHAGILGPLFLYYLGMSLGVCNSMLPLIKNDEE